MSRKEIRWQYFDRERVPEALFGLALLDRWGQIDFDAWGLKSGKVAIAHCDEPNAGHEATLYPALIVLGKEQTPDLLAWLHTYAAETFPLSQFARVLTADDWMLLRQSQRPLRNWGTEAMRWSCVVLGELLAQSDADAELGSIPLSRATACFSTTMARTILLHGTDEATQMCAERLRTLESDRRFVRRAVSVADLLPVWAMARAALDGTTESTEIARLVVEAAASQGSTRAASIYVSKSLLAEYLPAFSSDSIEERVRAFYALARSVTFPNDTPVNRPVAALLAAGAFLVGRGTSHAFLLRKYVRSFSSTFAWFGLMAAFLGPRGWDPTWSRMAKGVERQLRATFEWTDPPSSDLCWPEYHWMANVFDGVGAFVELPRIFPRVLSVEVIPGAICQLRFESALPASSNETDGGDRHIDGRREQELRVALDQFVSLALRMKPLLEAGQGRSEPGQQEPLGFGETETKKASRIRRTKPRQSGY